MYDITSVPFYFVRITLNIGQGSVFILYDTTKTIPKRRKLLNQMLSTLSVFDVMGSIAYAFTTLPTPESDYIYGSRGNDATCTSESTSTYFCLNYDYARLNFIIYYG